MATCCVGNIRVKTGKWYSPKGKTALEITYCEYCIINKCIDIADVVEIDLTDNLGGCTCDCIKSMEHPRMKMDCCTGPFRNNYGTWYVPNGMTKEQCTYCEWCVDNGCYDKNDMKLVTDANGYTFNCDCKREHTHIVSIMCPECYVQEMEGMGHLAACGKCVNCGNYTPYGGIKYCPSCSYISRKCHQCCINIKSGNDYLEMITKFIEDKIKSNNERLADAEKYELERKKNEPEKNSDKKPSYNFNYMMKDYFAKQNQRFQQELEAMTLELLDKTDDEMFKLLVEKARRSCYHCHNKKNGEQDNDSGCEV